MSNPSSAALPVIAEVKTCPSRRVAQDVHAPRRETQQQQLDAEWYDAAASRVLGGRPAQGGHRPRRSGQQMRDRLTGLRGDQIGQDRAMAGAVVALEAEQAGVRP